MLKVLTVLIIKMLTSKPESELEKYLKFNKKVFIELFTIKKYDLF